jgi:carbonic anhydrase
MVGELLNKSAAFEFLPVPIGSVELVHEDSIIKMKASVPSDDFSFGNIIDIDYVEYSAKEIHFHTPAEHEIDGR